MSKNPVIQLDAKAGTSYRAVFPEIDEPTGKPVTSTWYGSWTEVLEEWGNRGFERIEAFDHRVDELKGIVRDCEVAYANEGSVGVTKLLYKRLKEQAEYALVGFEAGSDLGDLRMQIAYDRVLNATPFRDPENHDWLITGVSLEILFAQTFDSSKAEPEGAAEMNKRLRVSFTPEAQFEYHVDGEDLEFSNRRFGLLVQTSPGLSHTVPVEQDAFESVIARNLDKFAADPSLQSLSYSLIHLDYDGHELPLIGPGTRPVIRGAGQLGTPTQRAELNRSLAWLKKVGGLDDEYLNRWSDQEWLAWQKAMLTPRWATNPCLPDWMNRDFDFEWSHDFSLSFPQVAQLWPTADNWFLEADRHDDFTLEIDEPMEGEFPDLATLRGAWVRAAELGLVPMMHMIVKPHPELEGHVIGVLDALVVVGEPHQADAVSEIEKLMPVPGADYLRFGESPRDLLQSTNQFPQRDEYIGREWGWL